ncbi:hypothetical protein HAX54_000906 [Datura stramonium]|uniref:Aminopeptidase N n=1 Tax=Datura stramonium TaxID=4076 RepID=A0ABS8T2Q8_DATST|nr:hypothetical protein [Datura stramonium]
MEAPKEIFLKDYKQPDYYFDTGGSEIHWVRKVLLSPKIAVNSRVEGHSSHFVLDGRDLKLQSVKINGNPLKEDFHGTRHLTLKSPPSSKFCTLEIVTEIYPQKNTSLEGLYKSSGNFCTQCEAEGFRKITFYQSKEILRGKDFTVIILSRSPVIFFFLRLVAGQLESRDDTFTNWFMKCGKVFGREYDLDLFNIVAVLICHVIFNSKLVLRPPETATDADYAANIGKRLTVFRDQEFSSDLGSRPVKRIADVSKLRMYQFPQDAGPMAHPGAEVVRMYKPLLGSQGFRKGTDLYFKRHDGQAVTCEDFFAAMRDANSADFANFLLWYSQAGTPVVRYNKL